MSATETPPIIGYVVRGPNDAHAVFWCDQHYHSRKGRGNRSPITAHQAAVEYRELYDREGVQVYTITG